MVKLNKKEYEEVSSKIMLKTYECMTDKEKDVLIKFSLLYAQNFIAVMETSKIVFNIIKKIEGEKK